MRTIQRVIASGTTGIFIDKGINGKPATGVVTRVVINSDGVTVVQLSDKFSSVAPGPTCPNNRVSYVLAATTEPFIDAAGREGGYGFLNGLEATATGAGNVIMTVSIAD